MVVLLWPLTVHLDKLRPLTVHLNKLRLSLLGVIKGGIGICFAFGDSKEYTSPFFIDMEEKKLSTVEKLLDIR